MKFPQRYGPLLLALLAGLALASALGYKLVREHSLAIASARTKTQDFSTILEEHARQTLHRVTTQLQQAHDVLDLSQSIEGANVSKTRAQLTALLPADRLIAAFDVLDRNGHVILTTRTHTAKREDPNADKDYFEPHVRGADREWVFGAPISTGADGSSRLPVSRRITLADGSWGGVLVAMVNPAYFQSFYDSIYRGEGDFVSLFLTSGWLVVTAPHEVNMLGRNWSAAPMFSKHMPNWPTGTEQQVVARNNTTSLYSYRVLNDYPVVVVYGLPMSTILRNWRQAAWRDGLLLALALAVLASAGVALARQDKRRRLAEKTLDESQQRYRALIEFSPVGIAVQRGDRFVYANPAVVTMLGAASADPVLQTPVLELVHVDSRPAMALRAQKRELMPPATEPRIEARLLRFDGAVIDVEIEGSAIVYGGSQATQISIVDITERHRAAREIEQLAFYDPLTGLPNRRLLMDRLRRAVVSSGRHECRGSVLFLDLDHFKDLNDTLGHNMGDALLQEVARRLGAVVREGDTVARLGGDEFVVLLEGLSEDPTEAAEQTKIVSDKILLSLNQPYLLGTHAHHSTVSMGAVLFGAQDESIDELLKQTDLAMYAAKAAGRNAVRFYDPQMQARISERALLEADLRHAVREGQFLLYFQRQVTHAGVVVGAEVLLRWMHPQRGMVSPAHFIAQAEDSGQIVEIGMWVLQKACERLAAWSCTPRYQSLQLAVNVSARQFRQPDFVDQVRNVIAATGAPADHLKIELTESLVLHNVEDTIQKMHALKAFGVRFAMDDFGTGQSSLSYLTQLPLDQLKIDQSFVNHIGVRPVDALVVQTIIGMANSLGMEVIAEGVETEAQRAFLEQNGCPMCQGYLFGRPVPLAEFESADTASTGEDGLPLRF